MAEKRVKLSADQRRAEGNCSLNLICNIFPAELWELVLDQLDDGSDIQNAILAVPQLDVIFHSTKINWFFDQVFPHIYKQFYSGYKDVLNCRLVSQRWRNAVDTFLQNHPSNQPYLANGLNRRNLCYHEMSYRDMYQDADSFPSVELTTAIQVTTALGEMIGHPRNPFVCRCVKFIREDEDDRKEAAEAYLDEVLTYLSPLGHHIWDVTLQLQAFNPENFTLGELIFDKIVLCLHLLPNIKSLQLCFRFEDNAMLRDIVCYKVKNISHVPSFQHLRSLHILDGNGMRGRTLTMFINKFFNGLEISKLEIPLLHWNPGLRSAFANISELVLDMMRSTNYDKLPQVISAFNSGCLKRLKVRPSVFGKSLNINNLLRITEHLELHELEILNYQRVLRITDDRVDGEHRDSYSSIKYLRIFDTIDIDYEFLKTLPCLTHLRIELNGVKLMKQMKRRDGETKAISATILSVENISFWKQYVRECNNVAFYVQ